MIVLAGIGVKFEDIPIGVIEEIKNSDYVFLEYYTSLYQDVEKLKELRRDIKFVSRKFVEEELEKFLMENMDKKIVLLVIGDPLIATTHFSLIEFCIKNKIKYKIYHANSILNLISRTGLFMYKFGKIASISFHESNYPYKILEENKKIGAHTLFLLDLDTERGKFISPKEALNILLNLEKKNKKNIICENDAVIVLERLGWEDGKIYYDKVSKIIEKEWRKYPYSLVIPGNLNKIEEEFLKLVSENV